MLLTRGLSAKGNFLQRKDNTLDSYLKDPRFYRKGAAMI